MEWPREVTAAFDDVCRAMHAADNELGKLLALRNGAENLTILGDDDAIDEAIDRLSDSAIGAHALKPDDCQDMIVIGKKAGLNKRANKIGRFDNGGIGQGPAGLFQHPDEAPREIRFKLIPFDDMQPSLVAEYLVKGMLPRRGLAVVWGPPKEGKSFWIFDVCMHIALGRSYRGHKVQQNEVVYLALEGQAGFGNRKEAFRQRFMKPDERISAFKLCGVHLDLVKDRGALVSDIRRQSSHPACVVIDTLNRSLVGSESKDEDMAAYIAAADAIQEAFGCLVVIVHHCGHDGVRPRGHSSLLGAADVLISVKKDASGTITSTVEMAKDIPDGASFTSRLEVVELGNDQDGDRISSCVVVPVEPVMVARGPKLTDREQNAVTALANHLIEAGFKSTDTHVPVGVNVVTIPGWRTYAYRQGFAVDDAPETRKKAFQRAVEGLKRKQIIGISNDLIWLPHRGTGGGRDRGTGDTL